MVDETRHDGVSADGNGSHTGPANGDDWHTGAANAIPPASADADSADSPKGEVSQGRTRRSFVVGMARRTAFIVPVVWTLTAQQAMAGASTPSSTPSCGAVGEPCVTDTDCCSDSCDALVCT